MGVGARGKPRSVRFSKSLWTRSCVHGDGSVHALRRRVAFELSRTDLAECRMATPLVIEHFDVIEQRHLRVAVARKPIRFLFFHGCEETLHHRIVIAVRAPTHAARDSVRRQVPLVVLTRVSAAAIGMMQQPRPRPAPPHRHLEDRRDRYWSSA